MSIINLNPKRVVVQIKGGLGNQLFQYATARRFAIHNDVPLILDHITCFKNDFFNRKFLLNRFNVQCDYIDSGTIHNYFIGRLHRRVQRIMSRYCNLQYKNHIIEQDLTKFNPKMLEVHSSWPVYLDGYWQHEEYFRDIRDILFEELRLQAPPDNINLNFSKRIENSESVCLHVRRLHGVPHSKGAKPMDNNFEEHTEIDYYIKAVEVLVNRLKTPYFFVFADYPDWAKENLHIPYPTEYVSHNGPEGDCEDFWLMGKCKHFIIANSTFSWWAAWLSKNPEKIVIAPKSSIGFRLQSTPDSWLKL